MEPQVQYAKTSDGVSIAFSVAGSGPPLVYARTRASSHVQLDWRTRLPGKLYEALAAHRTLITFDRRGAGLSDRRVSELTLETLTLDLGIGQLGPAVTDFPATNISFKSFGPAWTGSVRLGKRADVGWIVDDPGGLNQIFRNKLVKNFKN